MLFWTEHFSFKICSQANTKILNDASMGQARMMLLTLVAINHKNTFLIMLLHCEYVLRVQMVLFSIYENCWPLPNNYIIIYSITFMDFIILLLLLKIVNIFDFSLHSNLVSIEPLLMSIFSAI